MKALVTGAAGFVGANLVRRLLMEGHDVVAAVRPGGDPWRLDGIRAEVDLREVDLCDGDACAALGSDAEWIFHLAAHGAYSWQTDSARIVETNLVATMALLRGAVAAGFDAFVHAGSSSEYGYKDHAPREDELPAPNSEYAVAKVAATMHCGHVAREADVHAVTLRLYSVFGPWEDPGRLLPTLIVRGLDGQLPPLVAPETARDFVYVDDVCDAFLAAARATGVERGAVYNVGSGSQTSIGEIVEVARRVLSIDAAPEYGSTPPRRWDTAVWVSDPARAAAELGWRPRHGVEEGFRRMVEWFESDRALVERYAGDAGR